MKKTIFDKLNNHQKPISNYERYLQPPQVMKIQYLHSDIGTQQIIQNHQQFLYGRLLIILHPIISRDTLSLYMKNLQLYSKLFRYKQQVASKDSNIKQNFINEIESLQKSIQQSQDQIQQQANAILKCKQQYTKITNTIQQLLLPKISKQFLFLDNNQNAYPQLLRICINEMNNKQKSTNIKCLRLQRQLSQITTKIKQNKKITLYNEDQKQVKLQDINLIKYENQLLIQKRKEMDNVINILKDKNKQLKSEVKKLREFSDLTNSKYTYSQYQHNNDRTYNRESSVDHNRSHKLKYHTRNNSAQNNFKNTSKQQISSQNNYQNKRIYTQKQTKNYKQIVFQQAKLIKLLKQQLKTTNKIKQNQMEIIDKATLNKIQQFRKQVNLILEQSQNKLRNLEQQLQYKSKMIQYSQIKISKIIKILRGRQMHGVSHTNDIVCNLEDIFLILSRNNITTNNQKSQYNILQNHLKSLELQNNQLINQYQQNEYQNEVNYQNINNQKYKLPNDYKGRYRSLSQQKKQNARMLNCIAQCPDEEQQTDQKQTKSIKNSKYPNLNLYKQQK